MIYASTYFHTDGVVWDAHIGVRLMFVHLIIRFSSPTWVNHCHL